MKSYNLLIFTILFFVSCTGNSEKTTAIKKDTTQSETEEKEFENQKDTTSIIPSDSIFSKNSGTIEWLNSGKLIRKGSNLYRIDNSKSFDLIYAEKKKCKQLIDSLIRTCPNDLATVLPKWQSFSNSLQPDTLTPAFPKIAFREEAAHFANIDLVETYNDLLKKELNMKNHFQLAKAEYENIRWLTKRGQKVKKGQLIGIAARKS